MVALWTSAVFTSELGNFYFPPFEGLQKALSAVHAVSGMPWWAVIVSTTLVAKLATFPLAIVSQRNSVRYLLAKPRIEQLLAQIRSKVDEEAFRYRWSNRRSKIVYRANASRILAEIYSKYDFHPLRTISLALAQIPIWVSLSVTVRRLCLRPITEQRKIGELHPFDESLDVVPEFCSMMTEGCLWFPDLTVSDQYFLLPLILAIVNYLTVQLHAMPFRGLPMGRFGKCLKYASYGGVTILPVASAFVPTGLCFYWTASSVANFLMYVVVKQPTVKRYCRIPMLPTDPQRPFRDLLVHTISPLTRPFLRRKGSAE
ncbi:inner membrane protein [Trichuris suis]|nr:inner membrane protein [Trichuris suis]